MGKACAWHFAKNGSKVVLVARRDDKLKEIADEMMLAGFEVLTIQADVSNEEDCQFLVSETISKFKKIDILINNAGISMRAIFEEMDLSVMKKVMDINFYGTVFCTKYALALCFKI